MQLATVSTRTFADLLENIKITDEAGIILVFSNEESALAHDSLKAIKGLLALYAHRTKDPQMFNMTSEMVAVIDDFIEEVFIFNELPVM